MSVAGNRAVGGAAGAGGSQGQGVGGGIYNDASSVYARYTEIAGNFASTSHDDVFGEIFDW